MPQEVTVRTLAAILCALAIASFSDAEDGTSKREAGQYSMSRAQLIAMHDVLRSRGRLIFTWDWKPDNPWEWQTEKKTNPIDSLHPVYGFDGDAWYTTDSTLEALKAFPKLQYVHIAYCCRVTDSGIAHLKHLRSLKTLVLYRSAARFGGNLLPVRPSTVQDAKQLLTDTALTRISEISVLESLHIADNEFSETAIMQLSRLKTLRQLALDDSQISDASLARLKLGWVALAATCVPLAMPVLCDRSTRVQFPFNFTNTGVALSPLPSIRIREPRFHGISSRMFSRRRNSSNLLPWNSESIGLAYHRCYAFCDGRALASRPRHPRPQYRSIAHFQRDFTPPDVTSSPTANGLNCYFFDREALAQPVAHLSLSASATPPMVHQSIDCSCDYAARRPSNE